MEMKGNVSIAKEDIREHHGTRTGHNTPTENRRLVTSHDINSSGRQVKQRERKVQRRNEFRHLPNKTSNIKAIAVNPNWSPP